MRYCRGAGPDNLNTYNVLDVTLAQNVPTPDLNVTRNFYTTSSCGVCGKASLEAVQLISRHGPGDDPSMVAAETLAVDLASQSGLTLVAFLRGDSMNIYTRPDRIKR